MVAAAPAIRSLFTHVKSIVHTQHATGSSASRFNENSKERPFQLLEKKSGILSTTTIRVTTNSKDEAFPDIEMNPLYSASANVER